VLMNPKQKWIPDYPIKGTSESGMTAIYSIPSFRRMPKSIFVISTHGRDL